MVSVQDISVQVGKFRLQGISFTIPDSSYCCLMGKTGSGKTTIMEAICGLLPVSQGRIVIDETNIVKLKPSERGIGFVPQDGALFSTMTVRQQLSFALMIRKWPRKHIEPAVSKFSRLLGINYLLDRKPNGLSGGERQRVALGRALSFQPRVLCLDEPLTALDDETKIDIMNLLRRVREETGVTTIHITHSLDEARHLADKILLLKDKQVINVEVEWLSDNKHYESISENP